MKVTKPGDGILEITDFPRVIVGLGLVLVIGSWIAGGVELIRGEQAPIGILARVVVVTLIAGGAMLGFWERSSLRFDAGQQTLSWSRSGPFRKTIGGILAFNQISDVEVQVHDYKFRLALHAGNNTIPVTNSYSKGKIRKRECEQTKLAIESLLRGDREASA